MSAELERETKQGVRNLLDLYEKGDMGEDQFRQFLAIWTGKTDPAGRWQELRPNLGPDLQLPIGFLFGCRFSLVLDQPDGARPFFQEILRSAPADSIYRRWATEELTKVDKK